MDDGWVRFGRTVLYMHVCMCLSVEGCKRVNVVCTGASKLVQVKRD